MKYKVIIFGCQFNQSDSERAEAILERLGYEKTGDWQVADLILVFSCSVRQTATDRLYGLKQKFERIKTKRPLITILSGCILKSDKKKLQKFFDIILESKDLVKLSRLLKTNNRQLANRQLQLSTGNYFQIHPSYHSKFQVYVPIMTGCNNFCSYCVVPYTRGREVSRPANDVLAECKDLISQDYKFITLIGQNVNSYQGSQDGKIIKFPRLLTLVDQISGDYWLSFATSHPKDMSDELIKVMAQGRHIIPYLHLPVQSGADEILRKMSRHYTVAHYKELIRKIRKAIPNITISTDIIVGFPTEIKTQFSDTTKLFREVKFDMAYIAQYSPRAGTVAAKMADDVTKEEKQQREKILTNVLKKTALANNKRLVGQNIEVLVDAYKDGFCFGKTRNFKNIKFAAKSDLTGQLVMVRITDYYAWGLSGELPKILVILGPTASGKTKLAVKLAKKFNGEIISADSRQVYQGMDIGTGKDLAEYGRVPYHLVDVINPKNQFTVADWQKQTNEAIKDILKKGKLPIICGGTGLYISALVEGYQLKATNSQLIPIRRRLAKLTLKQLLSQLKKIDQKTYQIIDKNNRRRVQRALEIYYQTGQTKSAQLAKQNPPYDFLQIGLTFPKETLRKKMSLRLKHRLEKEGMVAEVKRLHRQGISWQRLEEFGLEYRYIARYLQGKISYRLMQEQLDKAIADFAKRQITWFKRDKKIHWFNDPEKISKFLFRLSG